MDIDNASKMIGLVSSVIAIVSTIVGVIIWWWKRSRFSKQLARNLEIVKSSVRQDTVNCSCVLDFTLHNRGSLDLLLTEMELEVIDIGRDFVKGPLLPSEDYSVDISKLEQVGDRGRFDISQEIEAGKHDRFSVTLAASHTGPGVFTAWRLKPTFFSKGQALEGDILEVWLPEPSGISFDEARKAENIEEEMSLNLIIEEALEKNRSLSQSIRDQVASLQASAKRLRLQRDIRGWRRQMAKISQTLGIEDEISPVIQARLSAAVAETAVNTRERKLDFPADNMAKKKIEDSGEPAVTHPVSEQGDPFEALLDEPDFTHFNERLGSLYFHGERSELIAFIQTERFCDNVQKRMRKAFGVKEMVSLFDYLYEASRDAAREILIINGFISRILTAKLNEEPSIENISNCLYLVGNCERFLLEQLLESDKFDTRLFIEKINNEQDLEKIGHALLCIALVAPKSARVITSSNYFELNNLTNKVKKEKDRKKIEICIQDLVSANEDVAREVVISSRIADQELIDKSAMQTLNQTQPESVIEVATGRELLEAIGSNRRIILTSFEYRFDELGDSFNNPHVSCDYRELIISGVTNLCIVSESRVLPFLHKLPQLLASETDVFVITFRNSSAITLSNLEMGHIPEGECSAGVVHFDNCQNMRLVDCVMFGSGTEGLSLDGCDSIKIESSKIHSCNLQILSISDTRSVTFTGCEFCGNSGCDLILIHTSEAVVMEDCNISSNACSYEGYSLFSVSSDSMLTLIDSRLTYNKANFFIENKGSVELQNCRLEDNQFTSEYKHP